MFKNVYNIGTCLCPLGVHLDTVIKCMNGVNERKPNSRNVYFL